MKNQLIVRNEPDNKRRITFVANVVEIPNNKVNVTYNYSICSPRDQFNKKIGVKIAEGRLKKNKKPSSAFVCDNDIKIIKNKLYEHLKKIESSFANRDGILKFSADDIWMKI